MVWRINSRRLLQSRGGFFICAFPKKALNLYVFHLKQVSNPVLPVAAATGIFYLCISKKAFKFALHVHLILSHSDCQSLQRLAFFMPSKINCLLCLLFQKTVFIFVGSIH